MHNYPKTLNADVSKVARENVRPFGNKKSETPGLEGVRGIVSEDLRTHNRKLVLEEIFRGEMVSRNQLARTTGLTGAAISRITRELIATGLLKERIGSVAQCGPGRPTRELELVPTAAFVVGVGIGAYEQWVQLADLRGQCLARSAVHLSTLRTFERALTEVAKRVNSMAAKSGIPRQRIIGCGVAMAGLVDPVKGTVIRSPNIGWEDVPVALKLSTALGVPVYVDAMHHALNLAEARRGQSRQETVILVNAAMGIGSSVMLQGHILRGTHAAAGQIGHMHIPGEHGLCTCGRRGCLDTVASGYAILRHLKLIAGRSTAKEHNVEDARRLLRVMQRQPELRVRRAIFEAGRRLGQGMDIVQSVVDADRFILAGPLSQSPVYVDGVRAALGNGLGQSLAVSGLTADSAAAWLALERYFLSATLDLNRLAT